MGTPERLLVVSNLTKSYRGRGRHSTVHAAVDVNFHLEAGETLAVVGESGSGKSTVANSVLQLPPPTDGSVLFMGRELVGLSSKQLRSVRSDLQVVYQDPYASINDRMSIREILAEPLAIHRPATSKRERLNLISEMLELVGLSHIEIDRRPTQLSGGQRQRLCIARSLMVRPKLLVCDEVVSALDVSVQAQILALLKRLQNELGLAYLFITHDLGVVRQISARTMVMHRGRIVEQGDTETVLDDPQEEYTKLLRSAVPGQGREVREQVRRLLRERDAAERVQIAVPRGTHKAEAITKT